MKQNRWVACLVLALTTSCGGTNLGKPAALRSPALDLSRCVQEMGPGQGFPTIPGGHHAQATPKAALNDYLTIQSPTGVRLVPGGWQETSARFGHHAFAHVSGARVDRLVTVVPAEGGGWWVQYVSAC